jgi:hypothetical protein
MSTRRVVLRDDDDHFTGTKYVATRDEVEGDDYDRDDVVNDNDVDVDDGYIAPPAATVSSTNYIDDDDAYLTASEVERPYERQIAVRTYPETYSTRTISYAPVSQFNNDIDDQAFLDGDGATYIAAGDIEDACLRRTAVYEEPVAVSTGDVSYVPIDDVDDYAFLGGSDETYVEVRQPIASPVAYMPVEQDVSYVEADTAYAEPAEVEYVEAVSSAPVRQVEYVDSMPVGYVSDETMYVAEDDCVAMGVAEARPVYVAEPSIVLVEEADSSALLGLSPTVHRIARTLGYNEGFEDGLDDAQDGDDYEPSDGGAQGYKRHYGDKAVYRGVYRSAYLEGYQAGYKALDAAL